MTEKDSSEQGFEAGAAAEERQESPPAKKSGSILEFLIIALIAFALVFGFVRPFVVEAFYIPSESMVPTLRVGDRVFVNKFVYRFWEPEKGDIVVFRSVEEDQEDLIKRVVALPGDKVAVRRGVLRVNGEPQEESYVNRQFPDKSSYGSTKVPKGEVFV